MSAYFRILALFWGMILVTAGCNSGAQNQQIIFDIDAQTWLADAPGQIESTDHYGVLIVDVLEKHKTVEDLEIKPKEPISFELIKNHTYYILLIAYDETNEVLSFAEKEIKI